MFCKRGWSTEFMAENFTLTFRKGPLRKHRRKILVEREKSLLPAMQVFIEYKRELTKYKALCAELREQFGSYRTNMTPAERAANAKTIGGQYTTLHTKRMKEWRELCQIQAYIKELRERLEKYDQGSPDEILILGLLKDAKRKLVSVNATYEEANNAWVAASNAYQELHTKYRHASQEFLRYQNLYDGLDAGATRQKREFIMKCADETCRGFLSSSYKCGTCEKWTCSDCLVVIGPNKDVPHTCDPNTVESAKAIKTETRGCPKCATRIFKIDGCDQMWCVMEGCGTAFSWETGQIATGRVHNPHYYEWLRRTGGGAAPREAGDIPCGGLPTLLEVITALNDPANPGYHSKAARDILETHRNINDMVYVRLPNYPSRPEQLANKELDVRYLTNEINAEEWEKQLEFSEAKFNRKREIGQILQTLITAGSDIMRQIVSQSDLLPESLYKEWLETSGVVGDLDKLREFGNESLLNLSKREQMAVPQLGDLWKWKPTRALYQPATKSKTTMKMDEDTEA